VFPALAHHSHAAGNLCGRVSASEEYRSGVKHCVDDHTADEVNADNNCDPSAAVTQISLVGHRENPSSVLVSSRAYLELRRDLSMSQNDHYAGIFVHFRTPFARAARKDTNLQLAIVFELMQPPQHAQIASVV
jgi:hypothetical protein